MNVKQSAERLERYCRIDTQSDPESVTSPSTAKQFNLAKVLVEDLKELGVEDAHVDECCYVYGHLLSNCEKDCDTVGFIAHMDTAPDYSGENVNPRIIENYDGKDITLNPDVIMRVSDFPYLSKCVGKTLMVTDGSTLLGADDKAGITCIMEALRYWKENPSLKHGNISIAFTPDEEVGRGTEHFNYEEFHADYAYTMDGGAIDVWSDETFNAASAEVSAQGVMIHPGEAKDRMINALNVLHEFHSLLPAWMRPEHTENRDGFFHLIGFSGSAESAKAQYIIRDHDWDLFEKKQQMIKDAVSYLNEKYGREVLKADISLTYKNMHEVLKDCPKVSELAEESLKDLGLTPVREAVRGGTDGSSLTFHGLPCPNLGNGGENFHGRFEYCVLEELVQASELVLKIAERVAGV